MPERGTTYREISVGGGTDRVNVLTHSLTYPPLDLQSAGYSGVWMTLECGEWPEAGQANLTPAQAREVIEMLTEALGDLE